MNQKTYKLIRIGVAFFVSMTVSIAVTQDTYLLATAGVLTGMLFMLLAKSKAKIRVDEREKAMREKAAQMTYAIFAPTIGLGSFLLIMLGKNIPYLFTLGQVLAYLTLFLIALYSLSYHYVNKKFGGSSDEE